MQKNQLTLSNTTFHYFLILLKKSLPFMVAYAIITLLFSGILIPDYFKSLIQSFQKINVYTSFTPYIRPYNSYSQFVFPLISILSITIAILSFKFLANRQESDMVFSLPSKRSSIFFASYFAGLLSFLIPYIIIRNPLPILAFSADFDIDVIFKALNGSFMNLLMECLLFLACYSFSVFLCVNIGKLFDILLNYILLSILLPICIMGLTQAVIYNLLGMTRNYGFRSYSVFSSFFLSLPELINSFFYSGRSEPPIWITVLIYSLFFILFTLLSLYLFKIRKTEKAGIPFAFSYLKIIFAVLISFLFGIFFTLIIANGNMDKANFYTTIPAFFVSSLVVYLGISAIAKRSLMIFNAKLLFYFVTVASYCTLIAYISTNGFGSVTYVPKPSDVKSVSITLFNENQNDSYSYNQNKYWGKNLDLTQIKLNSVKGSPTYDNSTEFSSTEAIEAVAVFHKDLLEQYKKYDYNEKNLANYSYGKAIASSSYYISPKTVSSNSSTNISPQLSNDYRTNYNPKFTYTLNNGTKVERQYNSILKSWLNENYYKLTALKPEISNDKKILEDYLDTTVNGIYPVAYQSPLPYTTKLAKQINAQDIKRLLLAIFNDENAFNSADSFNSKDYCILNIGDNSGGIYAIIPIKQLVIKQNYTSTIAILNELGINNFGDPQIPNDSSIEYIKSSLLDEKYKTMLVSFNASFDKTIFKSNLDYMDSLWMQKIMDIHPSADKKLVSSILKDISLTHTADYATGYFIRFKGLNTPSYIFYFEPSEETKKLMK